MSKELIRLADLKMVFDDEVVLNSINLYINDKEFLTLLGPSGCGKTTTLRIIGGFQKPTSGDLLFDGVRINDVPPHKRKVNTVFQKYALFPHMNIFENVAFGLRINKVPEAELKRRVNEALELVNLPYRDKKRYAQYSLGMKQRLAIALAVMHDPELLILDEPINGLDPIGIAEVRDFIRALCDERGKTILLSSHILSEIALLADDIGIIDHGVLLEEESLAELERKNGKVLRFTVSNAPVAAQLLQQELGIQAVTVENERGLTVRDLRLDTGAAVRRFVEAGLVVSDAHLYEDTLEDYFKRITGGEGIA